MRILALMPVYQLLVKKNLGGKVDLSRDILRAWENHDVYMLDWKNSLQNSVLNYERYYILSSDRFEFFTFSGLISFFVFFLNPFNSFSFLNPISSFRLSLDLNMIKRHILNVSPNVIFSVFSNSTFNNLVPILKKKYPSVKIILAFHHGVSPLNKKNYDLIINLQPGIMMSHRNLRVITPFIPTDIKPSINEISENRKYITFIGQLVPRKNLEILIKAFLLIKKDFELVVIGVGPLLNELKGNYNDSRIQFLGDCSNFEKIRILRKSICFVMPSTVEGFGIVYLEALSQGVPIIGYHKSIEFIKSLLGDVFVGQSFFSSESGPNDLAELIIKLASIEFDRLKLSQKTFDVFSEDKFLKAYNDILFN
jgi:glycosyltransferase involved in cell wall biosynthesis